VNLETLMIIAYNQKLRSTPFESSLALPVPDRPSLPYEPHLPAIDAIRDRLANGSSGPHFWRRP
jgi:hypothetical protein